MSDPTVSIPLILDCRAQDGGDPLVLDVSGSATGDPEFRALLADSCRGEVMDLDSRQEQIMEALARIHGRPFPGPWRLQVRVSADPLGAAGVRLWLEDNPLQDEAPHPSGGYTRVESEEGSTRYLDAQGLLHREDGPAMEQESHGVRTQGWYWNGRLHRQDGPALRAVDAEGVVLREQWWLDGVAHREDGPAVVSADGSRSWFFQGRLVASQDPVSVHGGGFTVGPDGALHH